MQTPIYEGVVPINFTKTYIKLPFFPLKQPLCMMFIFCDHIITSQNTKIQTLASLTLLKYSTSYIQIYHSIQSIIINITRPQTLPDVLSFFHPHKPFIQPTNKNLASISFLL